MKRIVRDMLPRDISAVMRAHLVESQTTSSQPQEGELSLTDGNNMMLSEIYADEVWPRNLGVSCPVGFDVVGGAALNPKA